MNHLSCFFVEPTLTGSRASEAVILSIFVYFYGFFELKKKSMMLSSPDIAPINHTHHRLSETVLRYSGNIVVTEGGYNTARKTIWRLRPYGG